MPIAGLFGLSGLAALGKQQHRNATDLQPSEQRPVAVDEAEHRTDGYRRVRTFSEHSTHGVGLGEDAIDWLRPVTTADQEVLRPLP